MAETYDIGVAPHCPLGPIAFAASLQIAISTPNFVICEMSWKVCFNGGSSNINYPLRTTNSDSLLDALQRRFGLRLVHIPEESRGFQG